MFLSKQSNEDVINYKNLLVNVASLSKMFSESAVPYLSYRTTETIFCKAFEAQDLSRADASVDAHKDGIGIGIKTFLNVNGKSYQKIAEFNSDSEFYKGKSPAELIETVSHLRNERLKATKRIYALDKQIYHCLARDTGKILVYECPMDEINVKGIKGINVSKNVIRFTDGLNEYSFNLTKSTLYKRFYTSNLLLEFEVEIHPDPFVVLGKLIGSEKKEVKEPVVRDKPHIFLPLFSDKGKRHVPERSGLNQWNAKGRPRNFNEIYIPIPAWIHKTFPEFFPPRDTSFDLKLPNGEIISAKVCQDGSKALMSNPNSVLGEWLLREVMALKEGELLTYDRLTVLDIDTAVVFKEGGNKYSIDFASLGSYDDFVERSTN